MRYWLAINKIPNLGPVTVKRLWEHFGSIEEIWQADKEALSKVEGISQRAINSILDNRDKIETEEVGLAEPLIMEKPLQRNWLPSLQVSD
jgi:DNA processing protein